MFPAAHGGERAAHQASHAFLGLSEPQAQFDEAGGRKHEGSMGPRTSYVNAFGMSIGKSPDL
jgi:hypothetical protein